MKGYFASFLEGAFVFYSLRMKIYFNERRTIYENKNPEKFNGSIDVYITHFFTVCLQC